VNPVERAAVAAWSALTECRTALLESRIWALEAQIYLGVAGSHHTAAAEKFADKTADVLESCEAVLFALGGTDHEPQQ
jgi:spore coat polysaccharide biosynthesis predicted glycosyltransferase SpsG